MTMPADAPPQSPFLSSDPQFDYWSAAHRLAYEQVDFALNSGLLFAAFTGDTGAGKTTVMRQAVALAQGRRLLGVLAPDDGLARAPARAILAAFGADPGPGDDDRQTARLARSLAEVRDAHGLATLVVDDAQALGPAALARLVALSGIEAAEGPLFRLMLVGRPEIEARLAAELPGVMGPLVRLEAMSREDTAGFVRHRMAVGGLAAPRFAAAALEAVHEATGGNPLRVNLLCLFCLDEAWERGVDTIDATLVRDCDVAPEAVLGPPDFAVRGLSVAVPA
ncbi:ExeA family protein [Palleronia sp. KMU-117]|uniref:ExeA family protein n=1 Tax=Palleronia sp. KMU-117 TaxID=3434108 RepID=UPI003D75A727